MRTNLDRLAAAIKEYEAGLGYTSLANYEATIGLITDECIVVYGGSEYSDFSWANLTSSSFAIVGQVGGALSPIEENVDYRKKRDPCFSAAFPKTRPLAHIDSAIF